MRAFLGPGLFTGIDGRVEVGPAGRRLTIRRGITSAAVDVSLVDPTPTLPGVPAGFPVRNTTLRLADGVSVATVEHVLSAAAGLGQWGATLHVDGPEVPIDDGSASAFTTMLAGAGQGEVEPIVPRDEVTVTEGSATIVIRPRRERGLRFTYRLDYGPGSPLTPQEATWEGDAAAYAAEVAPARTFSLAHEVAMATRAGLFKRFTPRELLVIGDDGQPIENAWRFANEAARHKLLDLIGDLALLGRPLQAEVVATRSGHALAHRACREVLAGLSR